MGIERSNREDSCLSDYDIKQKLREVLRESEGGKDRAANPISISDVILEFTKSLEQPPEPRIPTHLGQLNWILDGGFGPGELVYLAARAGVGKTALSLQFATAAARAGFPTLISSHEMMIKALARRIVSQEAGVSASALKRKELNNTDLGRIVHSSGVLSKLPLWLMDTAQTFEEIFDVVEELREKENLQLVIVDYLQRVHSPREIKERRLQVEHVSSSLKGMALLFGLSVLCMSAVNRPVKGQSTKPTVESLRETGNLEHDADIILLLHREVNSIDTELCVGKARDGATGIINMDFVSEFVRFQPTKGD